MAAARSVPSVPRPVDRDRLRVRARADEHRVVRSAVVDGRTGSCVNAMPEPLQLSGPRQTIVVDDADAYPHWRRRPSPDGDHATRHRRDERGVSRWSWRSRPAIGSWHSVCPHGQPGRCRLADGSSVELAALAPRGCRAGPARTGGRSLGRSAASRLQLDARPLPEDEPDRRPREPERFADAVLEISLVAEVDARCLAREEHEGRRLDGGLRGVVEARPLAAHGRCRLAIGGF